MGEEIADVLSYLIRLSDVCGIDMSQALLDKIEKNKKKYPTEDVKGNLNKYNEIKQAKRTAHLRKDE